MERKTKIHAEEGKTDIVITREFDLPVDLLYRAYAEPELIEQWMGSKVIKLEHKKHGSYQLRMTDPEGNVLFAANGVIHDVIPNERIVRTFEMENAGFDVQMEFLQFEALTEDTSRITMQSIFRSPEHRDKQLKLPFAYGINMAHEQLEKVLSKLK